MTVRWKPLMILSGLFLVVALVGVVAITLTLVPRSSQGILRRARAAREAGRFEDAEIYYKQALQIEPKNAAIHEEFAGLVSRLGQAGAGRRSSRRCATNGSTSCAARSSSTRPIKGPRQRAPARRDGRGPGRRLDLLGQGGPERRAGEPRRPLRAGARGPRGSDAERPRGPAASRGPRRKKAPPIRRLWSGRSWPMRPAMPRRGTRRLARPATLTLRPMRIRSTASPGCGSLPLAIRSRPTRRGWTGQVSGMLEAGQGMGQADELAPARVARLRSLLEQTQRSLIERSANCRLTGQEGDRRPGRRDRSRPGVGLQARPGRGPTSPTSRRILPTPTTCGSAASAIAAWK